jgi:hypothetical protein
MADFIKYVGISYNIKNNKAQLVNHVIFPVN